MTQLDDALEVLHERADWLTARIAAKRSIGWDVEWDTRERDALTLTLEHVHTAELAAMAPGIDTKRMFV